MIVHTMVETIRIFRKDKTCHGAVLDSAGLSANIGNDHHAP